MTGRYTAFDRSRLLLQPLRARESDLKPGFIAPGCMKFSDTLDASSEKNLTQVASAILKARENASNVLFMIGAHVLRSGIQPYLFDLMREGYIQGIAVNGAAAIHDYEIAMQNATTESVARYIATGEFGLWEETGKINNIVKAGIKDGLGFGEALGKEIAEGEYPFKNLSLFATAWTLGIPVTVHIGIGYDIIHGHPNCDGAALGAASYRDFLIFAHLVEHIQGGVLASFGSAIMAPEVFLKALAMARNVAGQEGRRIDGFTTLVCDLLDLPEDCSAEAPKSDPRYYFRPWKTLLARAVSGNGKSFYVQGRHERTIPALWTKITDLRRL